jgi:hypothetical protein
MSSGSSLQKLAAAVATVIISIFSDGMEGRMVRALWDGALAALALRATRGSQPPAILAGMLSLQGLVDVLFWSLLYAFTVAWETCECKKWSKEHWLVRGCLQELCKFDYMQGPVRMFVSVQAFALDPVTETINNRRASAHMFYMGVSWVLENR